MTIVGYARVSSKQQSTKLQEQKLNEAGCTRIYSEAVSGTTAQREELQKCLDYLREGDKLIVTKVDRLARSNNDLFSIVQTLDERGVGFRVLDQALDTTTKEGKLMLGILGSMAQFETEIRKERQAEGIQAALEKGVKFGAKAKVSDADIIEMKKKRKEGMLIRELMSEYKLSKASVYRYLK